MWLWLVTVGGHFRVGVKLYNLSNNIRKWGLNRKYTPNVSCNSKCGEKERKKERKKK